MTREEQRIQVYANYSLCDLIGDKERAQAYLHEYLALSATTHTILSLPFFNN